MAFVIRECTRYGFYPKIRFTSYRLPVRLDFTAVFFTSGCADNCIFFLNTRYDKNSNILSLDRYNGAIAATRYRYSYDGNRILTVGTCQTSPAGQTPVTEYAYRYDSMGNVTFNGAEALQVSYNYRNLNVQVTKMWAPITEGVATYVICVIG